MFGNRMPRRGWSPRCCAIRAILRLVIGCAGFAALDEALDHGFQGAGHVAGIERILDDTVQGKSGDGSVSFRGNVSSGQAFSSVSGFSIEAADTLDYTTDPANIAYILNIGRANQDGIDLAFAADANACFGLDSPAGASVMVGADRIPVSVPFDLATLGPCR